MADIKKNYFYNSLLTVANYLFPLITYPYVSRVLGVGNIGIVNYVDSLVNYFLLFSMTGIGIVGVREIAACRDDRAQRDAVFSSLLSLNAVTTLVAVVALTVFMFAVPSMAQYRPLLGIGVLKLLSTFLSVDWMFPGLENFKYITLRSLIVRTAYVVCVFLFIRKPEDYPVYYALLTLPILANVVINLSFVRRFVSFVPASIRWGRSLAPYLLMGLYCILTSFYTSFNVVYLGGVSDNVQVGYYASASKIFYLTIAMFSAFTSVMMPRMSALLAEDRKEEFSRFVGQTIRVLVCIGVPLVLFMEVEAVDIIRLVSGRGYEGAVTPLRIIAPLILVIGVEQVFVTQTMMPLRMDREVLFNSFVGALCGVLLNILLVRRFLADGSSVVWLVCEIVVLTLAFLAVRRRTSAVLPVSSALLELVKYVPLVVVLFLLYRPLGANPFVRFFVLATVSGVYFLLLNCVIQKDTVVLSLLRTVLPGSKGKE